MLELILSVNWVLIPITLLSLIVLGLILFNFFWLRKSTILDQEFISQAEELLKTRHLEELLDLAKSRSELSTHVLNKTIQFAKENPSVDLDSLMQVAESEGNRQTLRLNKPNLLLMDMGVIAPLLGLLGTVFGILRSFGEIASDAAQMRSIVLAGGVSQALVATAMGLIIGLVAMFFYAFFRVRVQSLIGEMDSTLTHLLVRLRICLKLGPPKERE